MDGIIFFSNESDHPLARFLKPGFRHCWCVVMDDRGYWVSVDGRMGVPEIRTEAGPGADLIAHYAKQGFLGVPVKRGTKPGFAPLVVNSCVGLVKSVLALRCRALTPYQLFRFVSKDEQAPQTAGSVVTGARA